MFGWAICKLEINAVAFSQHFQNIKIQITTKQVAAYHVHFIHISTRWLSSRLQYHQCVSNGDIAVLQ